MATGFACPNCGCTLATEERTGQPLSCDKCWAGVVSSVPPSPRKTSRRRSRLSRRVVAAVGLLLLVAALGGFYHYDQQPRWRVHESTEGAFRVDLPAAPRDDMHEITGTERTANRLLEGTLLSSRSEEYTIASVPIPTFQSLGPVRSVAGIRPYPIGAGSEVASGRYLDQTLMALRRASGVQRVTLGPRTTVADFPAMDAELELTNGGVGLARAVVSGSREYVLVACGPQTEAGMQRYRRFIDSFAVTDSGR